jgi:hypothetical protein
LTVRETVAIDTLAWAATLRMSILEAFMLVEPGRSRAGLLAS